MEKKKTVKKKKKSAKRKVLSTLRKDASVFLTSEEGKIIKKDIVKMAIAMGLTAAAIGTANAQHSDFPASHSDSPHADTVNQWLHNDSATAKYGHSSGHSDAAHADQTVNHDDHYDHSDHGSGGWC